jgi:hypothetical protein
VNGANRPPYVVSSNAFKRVFLGECNKLEPILHTLIRSRQETGGFPEIKTVID